MLSKDIWEHMGKALIVGCTIVYLSLLLLSALQTIYQSDWYSNKTSKQLTKHD